MIHFFSLCLLVFLAACTPASNEEGLRLKSVDFSKLPGWQSDDLTQVVPAWEKSCKRIMKRSSREPLGPLREAGASSDWQEVCADFLEIKTADTPILRDFFETRFTPYQITEGSNPEGLFTGYYEAHLRGSLTKYGPYQTPLYSRPSDLVMVQLGAFREDLKGRRIAGRVVGGNLKPYEDRAQIVNGKWPHNEKVLIWVDDPVDAFFAQIQGSGAVELSDGDVMRIGYAGQNGHPYYAIGRELIKREALTKETVSMQSIRDWLTNNPSQASEIMDTNQSYVFFRALRGEGPLGGEGVALTPGRSLAVDRSLLPYGTLLWLSAEHPDAEKPALQRLMVAQDTGGAIRGAVRGDVFWGYGSEAEATAGAMKSKGQYWILLPKAVLKNELDVVSK